MRRQQILTQTVLHIRQIVLQVHSPFPRNSWGQMCFGIKNFSDFIKVTRCTGRTLAFLLLTVTHRGTFNSFLHFHSGIKPKVTKWQNKKQKKKISEYQKRVWLVGALTHTSDASHLHHEWRESKLSVFTAFRDSELSTRDCGPVVLN